jgi:hypothetical protein
MSIAINNPLTRVVKRILDVFRIIAFIGLISWPLFVIVMIISQQSHPETWGIDIGVFSRFTIDLSAFASDVTGLGGVRDPVLSGKAVINIDTSSLHALYLFTAMTEAGGIVGLYVLIQLRALFAALVTGTPFAAENSGRIRKIGFVMIIWTVFNPFMLYFGGQAILAEYALNVPGIQLSPAVYINGAGMFIGLAMLVLAGVLTEAANAHEAQRLTI